MEDAVVYILSLLKERLLALKEARLRNTPKRSQACLATAGGCECKRAKMRRGELKREFV